MFALKSLSHYIFGSASTKESLIELPQGQLYIVRPHSPKGYSELIFKDAAASIRRTGQEFQYQLVIQRAYEEGEAELLEEEEGGGSEGGSLSTEKDERLFLLDESLRLRADLREDGEVVFAWLDLSGDEGDLYEFVCDPSVKAETASAFSLVAAQCQYERKYRKSREHATEQELQEFDFEDEEPIPQASPITSPVTRSPGASPSPSRTRSFSNPLNIGQIDDAMARKVPEKQKAPLRPYEEKPTVAPPSTKQIASGETLANEEAELHLFDFQSGTFIRQEEKVFATVTELGGWKYLLHIGSSEKQWLDQDVNQDLNPVFNFEYLSFIFNHYTNDGSAYSWLLRFKDRETEERFQEGLMQALWEHSNETKWVKAKDTDRDYVLDAFNDLVLEDPREAEAREEDEALEDYSEDEDDSRPRSEHYDSDESEDDVDPHGGDDNINSQLAVGAKNDRSFVVRGSKIGVFKHTNDNHLEFTTNISKVETPGGKLFSPTKVMLHAGDRNMVLQNANDPNSLYRMDLEYGKVVDEWKVHDDIPITSFAPQNKFAQMTDEQTFLGLSNNALYRVDPRLSGNKLVDSELKQYATKNGFTAAATTEKGYIAVASSKGDVRMFDRLGINAKTHIPALGDPIIGLDVSADGRWVLATTRTYLLLIDALQQSGKNEGKLGFEKSFAKDDKPQPRRLGLTPAHVAQFQHETKAPLSFTPAKFNVGQGKEETTLVTATGPFVITWSLKKVLAGRRDPYSIKRYSDEIKADNFQFGSDKNIVVALPNEVGMVAKRSLQRPTRESIMATPKRASRGGKYGGWLGRDDVVNSPY
ncbi:VID27-domain-containing protein [Myriangium duriaei CBS 260.36]|uniref:VID27-domain-containing protein n=1 Tax=Myriangium duriaei CBS 260.36 TaxID=1168546 RepID=A0A9P4IZY5_9PEZI|nr:VID27-domain-containing protein [Myriangium duriaei CBS 260.36]